MISSFSIGRKIKNKLLRRSGFTLIELAIVVVIVGILISVVTSTIPSLLQSAKIRKGHALLERADYALQGYIGANGRCPCPDTDGDGYENRTTGATPPFDDSCESYSGDLPYLSLGLSSSKDPWQNPIRYSVYENLVQTANSTICSSSPCTNCLSDFISSPNPDFLRTTDTSGSSVQAYLLASGGTRDMDGANGFFDGLNGLAPEVEFESVNKITDPGYDDLILATALSTLRGRLCSGGSGTLPTPAPGGEAAQEGGCTNALDDDGDGYTDCADQDCFTDSSCSAPPGNLSITTGSLPEGSLNASYSATLQATGGQMPYEWTLTSSGGLAFLSLHTYTGTLSGVSDQCPGNYTIEVSVQDTTSADNGGPLTDSKSFPIAINSDLSIERTSGSGTTIQWLTAFQEETFEVSGASKGSINWQLDTGGADGFTVEITGERSAKIKKSAATTSGIGPYTFTLTATDYACGSSNSAELPLTITIPSSGTGADPPWQTGPSATYPLDECTYYGLAGEVIDTSGNNLNGQAMNGTFSTPLGRTCRTADFDGVNDYLNMGNILNDVLGGGNTAFTITAFVNHDVHTSSATSHLTRNCFIAKASGGSADTLEMGIDASSRLHIYLRTTGKDQYATFGNISIIPLDTWVFIALVYDSGTVTAFINNQKFTDTSTWSGGGAVAGSTGSFTIGSSLDGPSYFNGRVDEVNVFKRALSDTEISAIRTTERNTCSGACYTPPIAHYRMDESSWSGTNMIADVIDSSGNGYHGTSYYVATTTATGKICRGGVLTNSGNSTINDRIYLPYGVANGLNDFSFSFFFKTTKTTDQGILTGARSADDNEMALRLINSSNLYSYIKGSSDTYPIPTHVADNLWHHVTWMRQGIESIIYLDGNFLASNACSSTTIAIDPNGLWLGSDQGSVAGGWSASQEFVGTIDEVIFHNRCLSESEIRGLVNATRTCN